jgi:hypothetical protein
LGAWSIVPTGVRAAIAPALPLPAPLPAAAGALAGFAERGRFVVAAPAFLAARLRGLAGAALSADF